MLKLQYFGHLMQKADSMDMSLSKFQKKMKDRVGWWAAVHAVAKNWTQLSY